MLSAIDAAARAQDVPSGTVLAEYGPGQFEVNLHHVDDALAACDHAIRLKRLVKGVALQHGMEATFMAKPYREQAGSGAHLHVSMLDAQGRNIFAAEEPRGSARLRARDRRARRDASTTSMALFAPTANSYRRFQPEAYVPLNPSWAVNNRGVAFRVPHGPPASRRVEHRVAGADANPYLLTATVLAGMHLGLDAATRSGPATGRQCVSRHTPDDPADAGPRRSLRSSAASSPRATSANAFTRLYAQTRRGEMQEFNSHVSALDYAWYLTHDVSTMSEHVASYYAATANPCAGACAAAGRDRRLTSA